MEKVMLIIVAISLIVWIASGIICLLAHLIALAFKSYEDKVDKIMNVSFKIFVSAIVSLVAIGCGFGVNHLIS